MQKTAIISILLILMGLQACESDETCSEEMVSRVNAGFYTLADGDGTQARLGFFSFYAMQRADSVIQSSNVNKFEFPLSMHDTGICLVMTADTLTDTLDIHYSNRLVLISWECGFSNQFEILSLIHTGNFIDSIAIVEPKVDPGDEENLKIYL